MDFLFGPKDVLTLGFRHDLLKNDDDTVNDGKIRTPYANVTYWLSRKDAVLLNYDYTDARFWSNNYLDAGDDYTGHGAGIRYVRLLTEHASGSIGYHFTNRDFDGLSEDYAVHEGSIAFEQAFAPDLSLSVECGYFVQDNDESDDDGGITYDARVEKLFERGSFFIGGTGGWDEAYLEAERRGFSRYYSVEAGLRYGILESLDVHGTWSYRLDKDEEDQEWTTWRRGCGLTWAFAKELSLSLDYTYADRDDDLDTQDYQVNRVMLRLTASKLWKW